MNLFFRLRMCVHKLPLANLQVAVHKGPCQRCPVYFSFWLSHPIVRPTPSTPKKSTGWIIAGCIAGNAHLNTDLMSHKLHTPVSKRSFRSLLPAFAPEIFWEADVGVGRSSTAVLINTKLNFCLAAFGDSFIVSNNIPYLRLLRNPKVWLRLLLEKLLPSNKIRH